MYLDCYDFKVYKNTALEEIQNREDYIESIIYSLHVPERHKLHRGFFSGLPKHIKVAKFKFVVNQSCNLFYEPSDDALP